jgi:hypothetical protein
MLTGNLRAEERGKALDERNAITGLIANDRKIRGVG